MPYIYSPPPLTPPEPGITTPPLVPLTLNGICMTPGEFAQSRAHDRPSRWLFWSMAVLGILFAFSNSGMAYYYVGYAEGSLIALLMLVALGLLIAGCLRQRSRHQGEEAAAFRLYLAASEGGVVTTLYPDRMVQTTARWQATLFFTENTRYVETPDLMIVEDGRQRLVLRAADLMPQEAQEAFECICMAVPPVRQYATGRFAARRVQPTPPPFSTTPPVCYDRFTYQQAPAFQGLPAGLTPWLLAICLVCAGTLTTLFAITHSFLLDLLLILSALFGAAAVISVLVLRRWNKQELQQEDLTVTLSFTGVGLRIERGGRQEFVAASDVRAQRTENGARLLTPAGSFTFPWTVTANRQQLEWMLFGQRPASF